MRQTTIAKRCLAESVKPAKEITGMMGWAIQRFRFVGATLDRALVRLPRLPRRSRPRLSASLATG
jgi:hypothetical protein